MAVMGKRFRKGKIYLWYSALVPEVVRRFHPRRVFQNSYYRDLEVLETRLPIANDTKAKFTLTNVQMKDAGMYYCDVLFHNGRTFQTRSYLDVSPGTSCRYEVFLFFPSQLLFPLQ